MKRPVIWLPIALTVLAVLFFSLREDTAPRHTGKRTWTTGHAGETATPVKLVAWGERGPELADPAVLFGSVVGPQGRPVYRAEVFVVAPVPQLVFTNARGLYEIELQYAGKHLVEARLHLDMAPQRIIVEVPEEGQPPRTDFRLKAAGYIFGEVLVGDVPVFNGSVDVLLVDLFGDTTHELDTDIDNGFFNFAWEPPRDMPLRLIVRVDEGFMENPIDFKYEGERIRMKQIRLKRYPTIRVRMKLPNGRPAGEVLAVEARHALPLFRGGIAADARYIGRDSKILVPTREGGTMRVMLFTADQEYRLFRRIDLVLGQLYELRVSVRPGPFTVRRRLTDDRGSPIRARFKIANLTVESGAAGWFSCDVPHGGLFDAVLHALWVDGYGWVGIDGNPTIGDAFLVDADDANGLCRLPLRGRVLMLLRPGQGVVAGSQDGPVWASEAPPAGTGLWGALSRRVPAGTYTWVRATEQGEAVVPIEAGRSFVVRTRGLTVVDAR